MYLGSIIIIGNGLHKNFSNLVLNNCTYDLIIGVIKVGFNIYFQDIAKASGYDLVLYAKTNKEDLMKIIREIDYE